MESPREMTLGQRIVLVLLLACLALLGPAKRLSVSDMPADGQSLRWVSRDSVMITEYGLFMSKETPASSDPLLPSGSKPFPILHEKDGTWKILRRDLLDRPWQEVSLMPPYPWPSGRN